MHSDLPPAHQGFLGNKRSRLNDYEQLVVDAIDFWGRRLRYTVAGAALEEHLTDAEIDHLILIEVLGLASKEIAKTRTTADATVHAHEQSILRKLRAHSWREVHSIVMLWTRAEVGRRRFLLKDQLYR